VVQLPPPQKSPSKIAVQTMIWASSGLAQAAPNQQMYDGGVRIRCDGHPPSAMRISSGRLPT
jgi:hypothetical protein